MRRIKIGSRKSELALWQTNEVAAMLNTHGIATEIVKIETTGDKILNTPISKIGSKGVFTEEIEAMLKNGDIDIAVHSAKDMPSTLPRGFQLIAFTNREEPNDVLVSLDATLSLKNTDKQVVIGTSSVRRIALLKHYYPHVKTVNIRGNLQTRLKKMESGECDALMLAYAGVKRMGMDHLIVKKLPLDEFVPPVGQGSIAIEIYDDADDALKKIIRDCVNHEPTEAILKAERAYLKELQGGCSIPAFAWAKIENDTLHLTAGLISLDGVTLLKANRTGEPSSAEQMGTALGTHILETGGREILNTIHDSK